MIKNFTISIFFYYIGRYQDNFHHCMVLLKLKVHVSKAPSPGTVIQQERIVHSIIGVQVHPHACKDLKVYMYQSNICHFKDTFCVIGENIDTNLHVVIRFVYYSYRPSRVYIFYIAVEHSRSIEAKPGK